MAFFIDFQLHSISHRVARAVHQGRTTDLPIDTLQIQPSGAFELDSVPEITWDSLLLPTVQECTSHLRLLHSIYQLREQVQSSSFIHCHGQVESQQVRARRWNVYLRLAVLRFLKWMHDGSFPPLDILMVWQACLLNPVFFSSICTRRQCQRLRSIPFPWEKINAAVQAGEDVFDLPSVDPNSGLSSDLLEILSLTDRNYIFRQISAWLPCVSELAMEPSSSHVSVGNAIEAMLQKHLEACGDNQISAHIVDAVNRQYKFVEKMEQVLWFRSPAMLGTIGRAISRYEKFVKLLKKYPKVMLVPTIDIDLVWHTHQCAGAKYQEDMQRLTGIFIDHDDKIGTQVLKGGERKTAQLFRLNYGSEYMRCFCWDCETVLSAIESVKNSGQKMNDAKRKEMARRVSTLVTSYKAAEMYHQNGF